MTSLSDEADDLEPGICPERVEECILESTTPYNQQQPVAQKRENSDKEILRKVASLTPGSIGLVMLFAMAEQFTFYGMTAPFMIEKQPGPVAPRRARLGYEDIQGPGFNPSFWEIL